MKEDVIEVLENADEPIVTASEVAEELGASRKTANERLQELVDEGRVNRKDVGSRAVVYWLPNALAVISP